MLSPCLNEEASDQPCIHGCCPTPLTYPPYQQTTTITKSGSTCAASRRHFAATTTASIFPTTQFTNHESLPSPHESFHVFTKAYPQYHQTNQVDQIRANEYSHLSLSNHTCLDYIGIGLFSYSQLLKTPSSSSSSSKELNFPFFSISYKTGNLKTQLLCDGNESQIESSMKKRIFRFLNISETDYGMVFTANRTSAFKLLAESYPFQSSKKLLTVYDYESEAVETMVASSEKKGANIMSADFSWPRMRIRSAKLREMIVSKNKKNKIKRGLFVFPLHSRITGTRYPYLWMSIAQENRWHVLIDACALGPKDMDCFGLSLFRPDFLVCSFYKVFGENPSGFGCLFVKKSTIPILEASSSTGIVNLVPSNKLFQLSEESSDSVDKEPEKSTVVQLEQYKLATSSSFSGPISYQSNQYGNLDHNEDLDTSIIVNYGESECRCLDQVDELGLIPLASRARCLINWLVSSLIKLKHPKTDGVSLVKIYGPKIKFDRGAALAFNVFDWKGEKVEPVLVQKLADRSKISLSYGFLHNIWFADKYADEKGRVLERRGNGIDKKRGKGKLGVTVVTAALGFLSNFEDTYKLWSFIAQFLDADFVEKERWRYTALNQKTIEV